MIADHVWKGNTNHTLKRHVMMHRTCFTRMSQGAEHVPHQLPNGTTRVKDLLKLIQCLDPELQAAIANVRQDDEEPTSKANNFEATATYIIPRDPVRKRRGSNNNNKRGGALISATSGGNDDHRPKKKQLKCGIGPKTG